MKVSRDEAGSTNHSPKPLHSCGLMAGRDEHAKLEGVSMHR